MRCVVGVALPGGVQVRGARVGKFEEVGLILSLRSGIESRFSGRDENKKQLNAKNRCNPRAHPSFPWCTSRTRLLEKYKSSMAGRGKGNAEQKRKQLGDGPQ
jgi:hypothetical protein